MPGFWLSAQLLFVLPNGVLSLCDAMVEGPLLAESCHSQALEYLIQLPSAVCPDGVHGAAQQARLVNLRLRACGLNSRR